MTEVGWWFTGLFFLIIALFYTIGFWAGKNWERETWQDKNLVEAKPKKISGRVQESKETKAHKRKARRCHS